MKSRLLKFAGLKFYLNPRRTTKLPFLRFHRSRMNKKPVLGADLLHLLDFLEKQQLTRRRASYSLSHIFRWLKRVELKTRGFFTGTFKRLSRRDSSFYPIFYRKGIMFLNQDALQAETYARVSYLKRFVTWGTYVSCLLARNDGLLLHAAAVVKDGYAYIFLGRDGDGKTTVANLSKKYRLIDDDRIVVRRKKGEFLVFPCFWSKGKEFRYSCNQKGFPIKAVFFLKKAKRVSFSFLPRHIALAQFLFPPSCLHYYEFFPDGLARQAFLTSYNFFKHTRCFKMRFSRKEDFWPKLERLLKEKETER